MRKGTIAFIEGTSWISKLIRIFDKGRFTHVGIVVSETEMIEAQRFQIVRLVPIPEAIIEIVDLHLVEEEEKALLEEADNLTGKKYDYMQILWQLVKRFSKGRITGVNSPKRLICSELVSRSLFAAGITEEDDTLFDLTPNELYDYLLYLKQVRRPVA